MSESTANGPVEASASQPDSGAVKAAEASAPGGTQDPASDAERIARQQAQGAFLSSQYVADGDKHLEQGDLPAALKAYASALEMDSTSTVAREKLRKVQSLMGDAYATAVLDIQDITDQEIVRRAQARMGAEDARQRAQNALSAGDYNTAIEQYRQAEMILRFNPLVATGSLEQRIVAGELEIALRMSEESLRKGEQASIAAATAARMKAEKEAESVREDRLRQLFTEANSAFLNESFTRAEELCSQILLEDPGNKAAAELQMTAREARHVKMDEENRAHYREEWQRTIEQVDTMNVMQLEAIKFDDHKRWAEVSKRTPLEFTGLDTSKSADKQIVLDRLDQVRFVAKFLGAEGNGSQLDEVANFLQGLTGVNFLVSSKAKTELDEEQRTIKLDLPSERTVRTILDIIAETKENLRWKVEDGVVKFVTKDEMKGGQVLRTYEVRDLIHPIPDFPGKEMNVSPSGGVTLPEEEKVEREANIITNENLETLIRGNVAKESWEADPRNSLRVSTSGTMVVFQTPEVHEQIKKLLDDLREATGIMVDIQARFLKVEDNFLEDIGVDFRGLGQPGPGSNIDFNDFGDASSQSDINHEIGNGNDAGAWYNDGNSDMRARVEELYDTALGDENVLTGTGGLSFQWTYLNDMQLQLVLRAVSKSSRVEIVTAPRISVHNTARGNLSVLNQVAYVQDFNVEIAQAASIADPIVNVVQDGVVLDVRPVVSADRRFITLELRPTIATLVRPILEVATTLGSQNSVTIQLPEVEIQRVRTSIPMPDGGTVLLGGQKISDRRDQASGVPFLNKIPLVSFLFERKGNYVSNRKLLILLKANIVIPQEHEPTPAQVEAPKPRTKS